MLNFLQQRKAARHSVKQPEKLNLKFNCFHSSDLGINIEHNMKIVAVTTMMRTPKHPLIRITPLPCFESVALHKGSDIIGHTVNPATTIVSIETLWTGTHLLELRSRLGELVGVATHLGVLAGFGTRVFAGRPGKSSHTLACSIQVTVSTCGVNWGIRWVAMWVNKGVTCL